MKFKTNSNSIEAEGNYLALIFSCFYNSTPCDAGSMCCICTHESAVAAVEINFQLDVMVKITV